MNRTLSLASAFVLALAAAVSSGSTAHAQPRAGAFGVGLDAPLSFDPLILPIVGVGGRVPGLSARIQISERLGLQGILGIRSGVDKVDPGDNTRTTAIGAFFRAHFVLASNDIAALGLFGGLGFVNVKTRTGDFDSVARVIPIEIGLRPEIWLAESLSMHFQLGMVFGIERGDAVGPFSEGFSMALGMNSDFFGSAGLTVWFGGDGAPSGGGADNGGVGDGSDGGGGDDDRSWDPPPPEPQPTPAWEGGGGGGNDGTGY